MDLPIIHSIVIFHSYVKSPEGKLLHVTSLWSNVWNFKELYIELVWNFMRINKPKIVRIRKTWVNLPHMMMYGFVCLNIFKFRVDFPSDHSWIGLCKTCPQCWGPLSSNLRALKAEKVKKNNQLTLNHLHLFSTHDSKWGSHKWI